MTAAGTESTHPLPLVVRGVLAAIGVVTAGWLLWAGAAVHLDRACFLEDTPYLPLCDGAITNAGTDRQKELRSRLAQNPAESETWIRLTNIETGQFQQPLLRAAAVLAPNNPNVLLWRAGDLLSRNQFPEAVELLVQLLVYRQRGEAAQALARIVATGEGTALLLPHIATADRWLPPVLASVGALKLPLSSSLPLMAEASSKGTISQPATRAYIRALRDAGLWGDAYGLWVKQQRAPTPLLHNGSFDRPFEPDGFDWEVAPTLPSRAGAAVAQRGGSGGNGGGILEIQFTGRPIAVPIIRQYVFAPPGKYLLRGRYMGSKLRMEEGLAWVARCTGGAVAAPAGRSVGLQDTAGAWQSFQFPITIPQNCGVVISLHLETFEPSSAVTGAKGRAAFDALELLPQTL